MEKLDGFQSKIPKDYGKVEGGKLIQTIEDLWGKLRGMIEGKGALGRQTMAEVEGRIQDSVRKVKQVVEGCEGEGIDGKMVSVGNLDSLKSVVQDMESYVDK